MRSAVQLLQLYKVQNKAMRRLLVNQVPQVLQQVQQSQRLNQIQLL